MKLDVGMWTNKELAQWFQCKSEKSFRNKKREYMEELKKYADFYESRGKVFVTNVYKDSYQQSYSGKQSNKKAIKKDIKPQYERLKDSFDSVVIKDISDAIYETKKDTLKRANGEPLKKKTVDQYVYEGVREDLGTPGKPGPHGWRELLLLICVDGVWRIPTAEEMSQRRAIINKYYKSKESDETLYNLLQGVAQHELSLEDVGEMLLAATDKNSKYWICNAEIMKKVGFFQQRSVLHWYEEKEQLSDAVKEYIIQEERG